MLSRSKYQEVVAFAHETAETVGCDSHVHERRLEKSDVPMIDVWFVARDFKTGRVFGDAELEFCRLPIAQYIANAMRDEIAELKSNIALRCGVTFPV